MAKYDFTNDNGMLKIEIQPQSGLYNPQSKSLATPSAELTNNNIKIFDSGKYFGTYFLSNLGFVGGTNFTVLKDAYDALSDLCGEVLKAQGGGA